MTHECRPVIKAPSRRKRRKRHPAEKPREHQWCYKFDPDECPGLFVCGRCKKGFETRCGARAHRKVCEDKHQRELERFANSLKDRRTPAEKHRAKRDLLGLQVYRKQGRPRHLRHVCKHCSKELPSAEKKHEQQRGCPARRKEASFKQENSNIKNLKSPV